MSGVYSVEDLLKLRASPLICKPTNLPAIEDILSTQDTSTKRPVTRGKPEDTNTPSETFQKRPLLDGHPKKSTTDPDRIVLGPPRRSFASSNARAGTVGKLAQEGTDESASNREKASFDRFKSGDNSDTKFERRGTPNTNGRYSARHDQDSSQNERSRRKYDDDDGDSRPRRDHDRERPKWANKDEDQDLNDDKNENSGRPTIRRDPQARSKFEQPWFRHDRGGESLDDTRKDGDRQPDWRRDRTKERDWDKSARVEADPEWMDAEPEEPVQVHTQEEFQRWKERMKAGSGTPDTRPSSGTPGPAATISDEKTINQRVIAAEADDSMDKFLARFSEAKLTTEPKTTAAKAPTKTRFASLFSPPAEMQHKQIPGPVETQDLPPVREKSAPPSSSTPTTAVDADQAGFARILEMLQTRSSNPPAQQHESKPKTPLYARDGQSRSEVDRPPPPPGLMSLFGQEETTPTSPQGRHSTGPNRMADAKSPTEASHIRQQSNKDELLLNLLRQANLAPKPTPMGPHPDHRAPPGILGIPDVTNRAAMNRNQMVSPSQASDPHMLQRRETGRSMFDEGPPSTMRYHDEPGPLEPLNRRPTNGGPPPAFFDDPFLNLLRGNGPQQQNKPPMQVPPPGLARPPGFDQMPRPPPGWPAQQPPPPQLPQPQQPPQQGRQPGPPPGISNIPRNIPSQYGPSNMPPQQHPNQPQRPPGGMPNFPPGMGPPPGFINNGPSMPMFPGSSGFGRFPGGPGGGGIGEQQQQQGPSGAGRAFMEMYSEVGRGGRGAAGGMPGFK